MSAYANADVAFHDVVDAIGVKRDPSHSPVFQTMFTLLDEEIDDEMITTNGLGDVFVCDDDVKVSWATAKFDIDLSIQNDANGGLKALFEYSTALFDR